MFFSLIALCAWGVENADAEESVWLTSVVFLGLILVPCACCTGLMMIFLDYDAVDVSQNKKTDGDDVESRESISVADVNAAMRNTTGVGEGSLLFRFQSVLFKPAMLAAYTGVRISAMNRNNSIYFTNIGYQTFIGML